MKKKSLSLQKLPEIYKNKKDRIVQKNELFQQKLKPIEKLNTQNELLSFKIKGYETSRPFARESEQRRVSKIISIMTQQQKMADTLEPIKEVQYRSTHFKEIPKDSQPFKTPSKKMDVDGYLKQKDDKLIEEDIKGLQIQNHRRLYLPSIIESQKKMLPFFNEKEQRYEEEPFTKLEEEGTKVKIRFLNNFQKWVSKASLKVVEQNEELTLESYRKIIKKIEPRQESQEQKMRKKEIIEKINIDSVFLDKMLTQLFNRKNPRSEIRGILREQLYGNYEDSVKSFNTIYVQRREIKRINRFQKKNAVSASIKAEINRDLLCSYNLEFLGVYMLNKNHYINYMVESYNIIRQLDLFNHFERVKKINDTPQFRESGLLLTELTKYFSDQRYKIEGIIFKLEEHLNSLLALIRKDIEHIIFLNPRLVGSAYESSLKIFITSFSEHLSKIIRSVLIRSINEQLTELLAFLTSIKVSNRCVWYRTPPLTSFYENACSLNKPFLREDTTERIVHGPGLIPIVFSLKKWKRKKYTNIFRFIIESRQKIRAFNVDNWKTYVSAQPRVIFKDPLQILQETIMVPLTDYFTKLSDSQNVNGCIFNKKIDLFDFLNLKTFQASMTSLYLSQKDEKLQMYATYFELWQHYYMQKSYIDDFIFLFKKIKTTRLIQEQTEYLKADLKLIKSFPNVIELQLVRLDISQVKRKIQNTIVSSIRRLLKISEDHVVVTLDYGHQQTVKARQLSQVTPYANLAEYLDFINFLNRRDVQKSIANIAEKVVFIETNVQFLQKNQYELSPSLIHRYLECGTWIKRIRRAALENKTKVAVDPYSFLKGVKDKKNKIFLKYNKMLKQIIQLMKVSELKNAMKLSVMSDNIAQQMKQICGTIEEIIREEKLLELQYFPGTERADDSKIYRTDLTFFFKEYRFLKKYLDFWRYASKLKNVVDHAGERMALEFDGAEFIKFLREGQQLISNIKISTLNKRFLHLCDEVSKQIDPFLKSSKLFLFAISGSQKYRLKVLKEISSQTGAEEMKKDPHQLRVNDMLSWSWGNLDWSQIYKIQRQHQIIQSASSKLNSIELIIKNVDISIVKLEGVGHMRSFQLLKIDDDLIAVLKYCGEVVKIIEQKHGPILKQIDHDDDILSDTIKKLSIFTRSIHKMKLSFEKLQKSYSLFQLIIPQLHNYFQQLNLHHYSMIYENLMIDYAKKSDLVKKLSFLTMFNEKVKIGYEEEIKKLEEIQIRFYNQVINRFVLKCTEFSYSSLQKQNIFQCLTHLTLPQFNEKALKLMGPWCQKVRIEVEYEQGKYWVVMKSIQTVYNERIKTNFKAELIQINKYYQKQTEKTDIICGLLSIIEECNRELQQKIKSQTLLILKLIYEFHYSTKHIFQFYIFVSNLLFQSVINALLLTFNIDLGMLWQNKNDLNLLGSTIKEAKSYNPKQKQNMLYVQILIDLMDGFLGVVEMIQERQSELDEHEKAKIKKMYAYNSLPKIGFDNFNDTENKHWVSDLKQEKEDDFIFCTHLNPELKKYALLGLDGSRIQPRDIEKKEEIVDLFDEGLNVKSIVANDTDAGQIGSYAEKSYKIYVQNNIAGHLGLKTYKKQFMCSMVYQSTSQHYQTESYRSTALLLQSSSLQKLFITNIHPNYFLLGQSFHLTSIYLHNYPRNMAVVVSSQQELLSSIAQVLNSSRQKEKEGFIYIYYDQLQYHRIKSSNIEEHCIVYEHRLKMHINCLLKKELNYNEKQVFQNFCKKENEFRRCVPWGNSDIGEKMITMALLRGGFDLKEREHCINLIYQYQEKQGYQPEISETKISIFAFPVCILTKKHFLSSQIYAMAASVYAQVKRSIQTSKDVNYLVKDFINEITVQHETKMLAFYDLPVHNFSKNELLSCIKEKKFIVNIQDKFNKDVVHHRVHIKPEVEIGLIEELLRALHDRKGVPKRWEQFRVKGDADSRVKWFIFDLSQNSPVCYDIFWFLMQSYNSNQYVFMNGEHFSSDFHSQRQKLIKDQSHKLIIIAHPSLLQSYEKDLPPIPILNESQTLDPMKQFDVALKRIKQKLGKQFIKLIDFSKIVDIFREAVGLINVSNVTVQVMKVMSGFMFVCFNELRKRQIALGHFSEVELSLEESKTNLMGAVDLREKTKLQHQQAMELQQIEKRMDGNRREIYKAFMQNTRWDQLLSVEIQKKIEEEYLILNPPLHNSEEINFLLQKSVIFAFYYALTIINPALREQLSHAFLPLTNRPDLYLYCLNMTSGEWQRWQQIDTNLTAETCTSDPTTKVLSSKEIIRLHGLSNKLQNLRSHVEDIESSIQERKTKIINMKGAEIYFSKLLILYQIPFGLELPTQEYLRWGIEYELQSMCKSLPCVDGPLQSLPEGNNKKIQKLLSQIKMNHKYIKLIKGSSSDLKEHSFMIQYKINRNQDSWYKTSDSTYVFIDNQRDYKGVDPYNDNYRLLPTFKVAATKSTLSPFALLTSIHGSNRFNDLQASLTNVLISLKVYNTPYLYHEHFRFRQYRFKGLDSHERQQVFGLTLRILSQDLYNECRKKMKQILIKIHLQQMLSQGKQELTVDQLQKLKNFDKIQEINVCLQRLLQASQVFRSQLTMNYVLRYMLKKPKKYEKIQPLDQTANKKKRIKSPSKTQFDDLLIYSDGYDRSNLHGEELNQVMLFFTLRQSVLVVEHQGEFTIDIKEKYLTGYRYFRKAIEIMQTNKNTKPFAIDPLKASTLEVGYRDISIYSLSSMSELQAEVLSHPQKHKFVFVYLYNSKLFKNVIDVLFHRVVMPATTKNHIYLVFAMKSEEIPNHGLKFVVQRNRKDNKDCLWNIVKQKNNKLILELQALVRARAKMLLDSSSIGKQYIPLAIKKLIEIKTFTTFTADDLSSKRQIYDKTRYQISDSSRTIQELTDTISCKQVQIKQMQSQLYFWSLKKTYYNGEPLLKQSLLEIRNYNRKKLQKQIINVDYLEQNPFNISYVYLFNILGDNNYFADKSAPLMEMEYQFGKNYSLGEDQKKMFQKMVNYGRLNAVIDNEELIFEESLISQEQLLMADKVRWQFVYLRQVRNYIFERKEYSDQRLFLLSEVVGDQIEMIRQKCKYQGYVLFNKYLVYLFTHKYIKMIINKKISELSTSIKKTKESIAKHKQRIQNEELKLSANRTYLQQIKSKYQLNLRDLQTCKNNEKIFVSLVNNNISVISNMYLRRVMGVGLGYNYNVELKLNNEEKAKNRGRVKQRKIQRVFAEEEGNQGLGVGVERKEEEVTEEEGVVSQIEDKSTLESITQYITEEMKKIERRPLTQAECQLLLSLLPRETINEILKQRYCETIHEMYHNVIVKLLEIGLSEYLKVFDMKNYSTEEQVAPYFDQRNYNILDLTSKNRSKVHYFSKELESGYPAETSTLLDRLQAKMDIVDWNLSKFSQKIDYVNSKSSESISKFELSADVVKTIEEANSNALQLLTSTSNENMFYHGQWTEKNREKWRQYEGQVFRVQKMLQQAYGRRLQDPIIVYYLRLLGMICKKVGLTHIQHATAQLLYDHSPLKNDNEKQIIESVLQKKLSRLKPGDTFKLSRVNTMDSLLFSSCRFILVQGGPKTVSILQSKSQKQNKILKRKNILSFYEQQNKSKQYWILIPVDYLTPICELIQQLNNMKTYIERSDEIHMKFIIFFQGKSWRQKDLEKIEVEVQPIYQFHFQNSATSVYYHTNHIQRQKMLSTITKNKQISVISDLLSYFSPNIGHVAYFHIDYGSIPHAHIIEIVQNLNQMAGQASYSAEIKLFHLLINQFREIKTQLNEPLSEIEKNYNGYFKLFEHEDVYEDMRKAIIQNEEPYAMNLKKWTQKMDVVLSARPDDSDKREKKVALSDLMKKDKQQQPQDIKNSEAILCDPYKFLGINKIFKRLIERLISVRSKTKTSKMSTLLGGDNKQKKELKLHEGVEITNKDELLQEFFNQSNSRGIKINKLMGTLSAKEISGSVGIHLSVSGTEESWLRNIFSSELYLAVIDKPAKNNSEMGYIKGVFMRYSEPVLYVKKEVSGEMGEEESVMKPLPQYKSLLPIYSNEYQSLGTLQMVTNQSIDNQICVVVKLSKQTYDK